MVLRDDASERVDPKRIGADQIDAKQLSVPRNVDTLLPYVFFVNGDSILHTLTLTFRQAQGQAQTVTQTIDPGRGAAFPTLPFAAVSCDSAGSPSSVFMVYVDVAPAGPSRAGGTGATVANNFNEATTPSANATEQMCGLGSILTLTPLKSGNVLLVGNIQLICATGDTNEVHARYGTGAAPALNAAVTGTDPATRPIAEIEPAAAAVQWNIWLTIAVVITGLTVGTKYWFDLSNKASVVATDQMFVSRVSITELPN